MFSGYLLYVWPCAWAVDIGVDMPNVTVLIQSRGEARHSARNNTTGIGSKCDPFYEGRAERAEHGRCEGLRVGEEAALSPGHRGGLSGPETFN